VQLPAGRRAPGEARSAGMSAFGIRSARQGDQIWYRTVGGRSGGWPGPASAGT